MNKCMICGREIPEDRHICLSCEHTNELQTFRTEPKTNGDRIRQMTDEELSEFLSLDMCSMCSEHLNNFDNCGEIDTCRKGIMDWIKKEID